MGGVCVGLAVNVTRSPVSNKNSLTSCVCVCVGTNSFMLPKYKYSNTGLMMMKGSRSSQPPAERLSAIKKKKNLHIRSFHPKNDESHFNKCGNLNLIAGMAIEPRRSDIRSRRLIDLNDELPPNVYSK